MLKKNVLLFSGQLVPYM